MSDRINVTVPIVEIEPPATPDLPIGARAFRMNGCSIILSFDGPTVGWHISIARRDRDPSWNEIATVRYRLLPDVAEMVLHLPPVTEYVNINLHCFHLFEFLKTPKLILPVGSAKRAPR